MDKLRIYTCGKTVLWEIMMHTAYVRYLIAITFCQKYNEIRNYHSNICHRVQTFKEKIFFISILTRICDNYF